MVVLVPFFICLVVWVGLFGGVVATTATNRTIPNTVNPLCGWKMEEDEASTNVKKRMRPWTTRSQYTDSCGF